MKTTERKYIELQDEHHRLYMIINYDYNNGKISKEDRDKLIERQREVKNEMKQIDNLYLRNKKIKKITGE